MTMPLIEELHTAKARTGTPGWAYVPDTGFDPSKAPIVPSGARNRSARKANIGSGNDISARQQQRIDQHLALLDRENHKDVQIAVPGKSREARGMRANMTPGVRKILTSNKTFANHLADEEAAIALKEEEAASRATVRQSATKSKRTSLGNIESIDDDADIEMPDAPSQVSGVQSSITSASIANEAHPLLKVNVPSLPSALEIEALLSAPPLSYNAARAAQHYMIAVGRTTASIANEAHPLLKVNVPSLPSALEIEALLSAPPLSYNAARAAPSTSTAPPRQFCEMCGYWGRVRCMKCGVRVCSLECQRQHDDSSCQKFWA